MAHGGSGARTRSVLRVAVVTVGLCVAACGDEATTTAGQGGTGGVDGGAAAGGAAGSGASAASGGTAGASTGGTAGSSTGGGGGAGTGGTGGVAGGGSGGSAGSGAAAGAGTGGAAGSTGGTAGAGTGGTGTGGAAGSGGSATGGAGGATGGSGGTGGAGTGGAAGSGAAGTGGTAGAATGGAGGVATGGSPGTGGSTAGTSGTGGTGGGGGAGTGGAAGGTGGTAGAATGGSSGSATGGAAGSAGATTGGAAGSAGAATGGMGGMAGTGAAGAGGSAQDGGSAGGAGGGTGTGGTAGAAGGAGGASAGGSAGTGAAAGAVGAAGAAGADGGMAGPPRSIFALPEDFTSLAQETFFDHPWPSDLRRHPSGAIMAAGLPRPRTSATLDVYAEALERFARGFSTVAAGHLRFDTDVDGTSLPADPGATLAASSAVQLLDVDPASPEVGTRRLISLHLRNEVGVYWPGRVLAFMPTLGHPLRARTRYALVVTRALRASTGQAFAPAVELETMLSAPPPTGPIAAAAAALEPSVQAIEGAGVARADIVHLSIFTTDHATREAEACRDHLMSTVPAPTVAPSSWARSTRVTGVYDVYEGVYGPSPVYQRGVAPYMDWGSGGELAFDATGTPEVVENMNLRFALSVPDAARCPMPARGYPIVLYAHGTGGSYRSFLNREANPMAQRCMAMMGIDQIFHGTRPGANSGQPPELMLFNLANPAAARANIPQSALDVVQQARLFTATGMTVPAATSYTAGAIRFDPARVAFMGHSQGGLNGPVFLALDDQTRGGVLSGSGSLLSVTVMDRKLPFDLLTAVSEGLLMLSGTELDEVNLFHPWMSAVQTLADPGDPMAYLTHIVREPRLGFGPKSLLMTEGVRADGSGDTATPPRSTELQAVAIGLPVIDPAIHPPTLTTFVAPTPLVVPSSGVTGNLGSGLASGALVQWDPGAGEGHFVLYNVPGAMTQAADFMQALMADPRGRVPAPW